MASKWTRHAPHGTVYSTETWEGDRRRTTIQMSEADESRVSPDVVLWADADHRVVVGQDVLMPDAPAQAMAESLRRAMDAPAPGAGRPRRPRRLRVRQPDIAEALRPVAESLGIQLELAESLPFVDDLFRDLEVRFGSPAHQGYLDASEVPEALLADFFAAASAFYRGKPWTLLDEGQPILLESTQWTPPARIAVVTGAGGGAKGMAVYESVRDLARLSRLDEEDPRATDVVANIPALAVLFTRFSRLGARRVEEAKAHEWQLASRNAYPLIIGTGRTRESHWPTPAETRLLVAAMRSLVPFARALNRPRRTHPGQIYFAETYPLAVAGEDVEVEATFPVPPMAVEP